MKKLIPGAKFDEIAPMGESKKTRQQHTGLAMCAVHVLLRMGSNVFGIPELPYVSDLAIGTPDETSI